MSELTRSWIALASLGAGIVLIAVGAGSPLALLFPIVILGVLEVAWGVVTLARTAQPSARLGISLMLFPVVAWAIVLTIGTISGSPLLALPLLPMVAVTALNLVGVAILGASTRRLTQRGASVAPRRVSAGKFVLGLVFGALIVSGVVTPALAATPAGEQAVPHGEHGSTSPAPALKITDPSHH